ncbi:hypothetical protein [Piscinibacter sakaiensis]|uniref:hypothetical protein n=1 Tax=Piscinibacter sakaiensis TaxID=1547922 RepID=UPI003AAD8B61
MSGQLDTTNPAGVATAASQPPAAHVSTFAQRELAPLNAATLLATGLSTAVLTVATDLMGPRLNVWLTAVFAAAFVLSVVIALMLMGREGAPSAQSSGVARWVGCLRRGLRRSMQNWRYALLLATMVGLAVYSAYVKAREADGGLLREFVFRLDRLQATANDTRSGIDSLTRRQDAPVARLRDLGFDNTDEGAWKALSEGNVDALGLMRSLGRTYFPTDSGGGGNALEALLMKPGAEIAGALREAGIGAAELDKPRSIERALMGSFQVPTKGLYESLGFMVGPTRPEIVPAGRVHIVHDVQSRWMAPTPAILLAVWAGKDDAVRALLERGANPNLAAVATVMGSTTETKRLGDKAFHFPRFEQFEMHVYPLSEARRLGLEKIEEMLRNGGANGESSIRRVRG